MRPECVGSISAAYFAARLAELRVMFTGDSSIQDVKKTDSKTDMSAHASKDINQGTVVNRAS